MTARPVRLLVFAASVLLAAFCSKASAAALDTSFGHDGRVAVELGVFGSRANAVVTQADGKIVAAGYASSTADRDFMLFRLLADGSLDPAFNSDGTVTTAVGSADDEVLAVAVQADGKIVAAGYSSNGENRDFAIVRYNSDGSIDRSFGNEGMAVTAVGSSHDEITGIAVQEDGGILITGVAQGADGKVAVLARYLADGSPDTAFADEGFSLSAVGVDAQAEAVALSKDGRILLSGTYSDGQRRGLMLLGFDKNGRLDKTFGKQGIAVPADSSVFSEGYGMFVNEDGTILVVGSVGEDGRRDSALFRFTADGQPDSSFENNGQLVTSAGSGDDVLHGVVVTGGTTAAAGFKAEEEQREFLLITYSKKTGDAEENSGSVTMQTVTGFGGNDTSTALAAVSGQSVVAVGESESAAGSGAAVSKYTMAAADSTSVASSSVLSAGSEYVWTGSPYDVTRTTAILPAEVRSGLSGTISKRGIVFGTMPNPSLEGNSGPSSDAPVMSNLSPSNGTISTDSATLSLATDVNAICKYDTTAGTTYDQMEATFSDTGEKSHSQLVTGLQDGEKKYYVRCKNTSSGTVNTTDGVISFTVKIGTDTDSTEKTDTTSGTGSTGTTVTTPSTPTSVIITDKSTPAQSNVSVETIHQVQCSGCSDTDTETAVLRVNTTNEAECKYGEKGKSFEEMNSFDKVEDGGKKHEQSIENLPIGKHPYDVICRDNYSNSNKIPIDFIATPVLIKSKEISGRKLSVRTDVKAICKYSIEANKTYADMIDFTSTDELKHTSDAFVAAGDYIVYVRCEDKSSTPQKSTVDIKITFTIAALTPVSDALFASSDQLINTALRNVGNFFLGTAVAQTSTTSTTDTNESTTAAATTSSTTNSSSNSNTSSSTTSSTTKFLEEGSTEEGGGSGAFSSKLTNLKPGTFFYARAYAISDGVTYYGNQVGFRTADSCFVATAAFGSVFHPAVQVLRDFRNQFLSGNAVSRAAVELYYQVSPSLADVVSQHSGLRTAVCLLLLPVTGAAWLILQLGLWTLMIPAAGGGLAWGWQDFRKR